MAPKSRGLNLPSLRAYKTKGPSRNKYHNFGLVFNTKMQLNERQNAIGFVISIEQEAPEANSFVDGRVREWRHKIFIR